MIGKTISHYKILEKLGGGGMGVVYKAEDTKLDRTVALKFLPPHLHLDDEAEQRFISEAKAASSFDHPNICTIYEIDKTGNDQLFIAMACYDGETLKKKLEDGPLEIEDAVQYTIQIAKGLERAHEAGITHRDIKPANIMITNRDEVKILDFGLAKTLNDPGVTKIGTTIGTTSYMSPEQAKGTEVNHQSDIWSLGVVMYQMITGKLPFESDYEQAVIYSILNEEPVSITEYMNNCPSTLVRIVNKCLQKDPADRFQTVKELLQELETFQLNPDYGLSSVETNNEKPVNKKPVSKKITVVAGIILTIIVFSFLLPAGWEKIKDLAGWNSTPDEQHLLVLPLRNLSGDSTRQSLCDGIVETVTSKLTQLEQFHTSLWVVPSSEVQKNDINSPSEANKLFGVNLVVTGSFQMVGDMIRVTLNLVDATNLRQLNSSVIDVEEKDISSLQDKAVIKLMSMLNLELNPRFKDILEEGETDNAEAYSFYLQGRGKLFRYENIENINSAIEFFRKAILHDSSYALAYAGLGEALWKKYRSASDDNYVEEAILMSKKAFELNGNLASVNITLGLIHFGTGKYDEAVTDFNNALNIDPNNADAYRGLGKAYLSLGRIDEAEQIYKRAIKLKPDYWAGYNELGLFYYKRANYEKAAVQFRHVIELIPDNYQGYNKLAAMYYMMENLTEARKTYEKALSLKKSYRVATNLGTLYYIEGKYKDAARMYEMSVELNDKSYIAWGNLAAAYFWIPGKRNKANEKYRRAITLAEEQLNINPNDVGVISSLAGFYASVGDKDNALINIEKSFALAPKDVQIMYRNSTSYELIGDRENALLWIERALKNGYSRSEIESQPELKELIADGRYKKIIAH